MVVNVFISFSRERYTREINTKKKRKHLLPAAVLSLDSRQFYLVIRYKKKRFRISIFFKCL